MKRYHVKFDEKDEFPQPQKSDIPPVSPNCWSKTQIFLKTRTQKEWERDMGVSVFTRILEKFKTTMQKNEGK